MNAVDETKRPRVCVLLKSVQVWLAEPEFAAAASRKLESRLVENGYFLAVPDRTYSHGSCLVLGWVAHKWCMFAVRSCSIYLPDRTDAETSATFLLNRVRLRSGGFLKSVAPGPVQLAGAHVLKPAATAGGRCDDTLYKARAPDSGVCALGVCCRVRRRKISEARISRR